MNDLNIKLQGSRQLINKRYQYINPFERKQLKKQITEKNSVYFSRLNVNQPADTSVYTNFIQELRQYFEIRFTVMHFKKANFKLFSQPFDVQPESANEDFQMNLIEFQSNEFYKSKLGLLVPL